MGVYYIWPREESVTKKRRGNVGEAWAEMKQCSNRGIVNFRQGTVKKSEGGQGGEVCSCHKINHTVSKEKNTENQGICLCASH